MSNKESATEPKTAKKNIFSRLRSAKSISVYFIASTCLVLVMTVAIILISYGMYRQAFYDYSNELCLTSNAQAAFVIDGDLVEHYAKTLTVDEEYEKFAAKLDKLKSEISARYFYILFDNGVPDMYTYIYDATHSEEFPGEKYALGRNETILEYEFADEVLATGVGFKEALYYNERYGELYYSYAPIFNSKGEVVAFVGTDIDIAPLQKGLNNYRTNIIYTLTIAFASFLALYLIVVRRTLTNPMNQITDRATSLSHSLNVLKSILNGMDAYLYVTDPQTDELLFINDKMKEHFNLGDQAVGQICWKVLQSGFEERCDFCPNRKLLDNPDVPVVWEEYNTVTGRYYENSDRIIEWTDGRKVHLQHSLDITELKHSEESLQRRLEQQELMSEISQSFIADDDVDMFINNALQMTGEFMDISRIMLAGYDETDNTLEFKYAWCGKNTEIPIKPGSKLPFSSGSPMFEALIMKRLPIIVVNDVKENMTFKHTNPLGIKAFLTLPIFVSGDFWGTLGFDQCEHSRNWSESDLHLASLIGNVLSGVLSRQLMEKDKKIAQENILRMSSIINSAPQYISYINKEGKYGFINPAIPEITGYSYEELMVGGLQILYDEQTNRFITDEVISTVLSRGKYNYEVSLHRKDGEERVMSFSAFTIESDDNRIGEIATDITEKKRLETELIEAKELAEQASKAKGEFLSRMSHEMRTPMNAIIGMTNIAKGTDDPEKKEHCLDRIDIASKHLLNVINDILDMSKIEADKFELYCQEFDFEKMLVGITSIINFRTEEKKQNLIINLDKNIHPILVGDEGRITQVITNLLTNAIKFTPEGGTIILNAETISESGEICTLRIEVIDNGIGISAEQQARLFNSFVQADGGIARKFGGTGLGLAISKRIVELMGGKIWIESELGAGSKFIFTINVKKGILKPRNDISTHINRDNIHILAVDDSPETRDYFLHVCQALDLPCDVAADGFEALYLLDNCEDNPYNIFFIDWQMPKMNGVELTRKIKHITGSKAIIIMISVSEWSEIEKDATGAGVNHFVSKPLFPSIIIDSINKCLGIPPKTEIAKQNLISTVNNDFKNNTLLLAEDVEVNREIIMAILEHTGVTIDFAQNGLEAVSLFQEHPGRYNLILMDIQMPEMDGYEASRKIRSLDYAEAKNIPIVAMTANVFREDIEACLEAGMNDHIGKPVDTKDLLAKLNQYIKPKDDEIMDNTPVKPPVKVSADYAEFLPSIDVLDGLNRLMNNKKLYFTLLKNFKGRQMADELIQNMHDNDYIKITQTAHALKGVAANLGLVNIMTIVSNIETQAKAEIVSVQLIDTLNEAIDEANNSIILLLESEVI